MTEETLEHLHARNAQLEKLREPFAAANIAHKPTVWCRACREAPSKNCDKHRKRKCDDCGNTITEAHTDLDYVGHAEVTGRLLSIDPGWTWEPMALDANGLPLFDEYKGLWMKLTICGVSRIGYGSAAWAKFKDPGDIIKEIIGDAIRNAGQRFGVALDLWARTDLRADRSMLEAETLNESFSTPMTNPVTAPAVVRYLDADGRERVQLLATRIGLKTKGETLFVASILLGHPIGSFAQVVEDEGAQLLADLDEAGSQEQPMAYLTDMLSERAQPNTDPNTLKLLRNKIITASSRGVLNAVVEDVRDHLDRFKLAWSDYRSLLVLAQSRANDLKGAPA